jgi:hypothetical protein
MQVNIWEDTGPSADAVASRLQDYCNQFYSCWTYFRPLIQFTKNNSIGFVLPLSMTALSSVESAVGYKLVSYCMCAIVVLSEYGSEIAKELHD